MCGRTACTLERNELCAKCSYTTKRGQKKTPVWREAANGAKYWPGYNIPPSAYTPILIANTLTSEPCPDDEDPLPERVIQPMQWGLTPSWHKSDSKATTYNMSNARSDGLLQKSTFHTPLKKGQRCVVLADGFYEWKRKGGKKQPYYLYFPSSSKQTKIEIGEESVVKQELDQSDSKRLLTIAGLYDVCESKSGESEGPLFSYSIITVDAHPSISWLHDRMPAILNGEEEVTRWLDSRQVPLKNAMELIKPKDTLKWHPVSTDVGNTKNKSRDLIEPIDLKNPVQSASSNLMMSWLGKRKSGDGEESAKKMKN